MWRRLKYQDQDRYQDLRNDKIIVATQVSGDIGEKKLPTLTDQEKPERWKQIVSDLIFLYFYPFFITVFVINRTFLFYLSGQHISSLKKNFHIQIFSCSLILQIEKKTKIQTKKCGERLFVSFIEE